MKIRRHDRDEDSRRSGADDGRKSCCYGSFRGDTAFGSLDEYSIASFIN